MSIELVMLSNHLMPVSPLAFSPFQHQGLFQWVSSLHQMTQVLELQYQSFQKYSGLISFRIDWFDLFAVQGTLKNLLWHHHLKASNLGCSAFFMVQLSHSFPSLKHQLVQLACDGFGMAQCSQYSCRNNCRTWIRGFPALGGPSLRLEENASRVAMIELNRGCLAHLPRSVA